MESVGNGSRKTWDVPVRVTGTATVRVVASTEEEAMIKAEASQVLVNGTLALEWTTCGSARPINGNDSG